MQSLSALDRAFLLAETSEAPTHIATLALYELPEGVDEQEYISDLKNLLTEDRSLRFPHGHRLKMTRLGLAGPVSWEEDPQLDLHYHIRHSALPKPGRFRELFALVSRLHSSLLDRGRPLWEFHLIEGLQDRQFATYLKFHHCALDGAGAMHFNRSMHSTSPEDIRPFSPFSLEAFKKYKSGLVDKMDHKSANSTKDDSLGDLFSGYVTSATSIISAFGQTANAFLGREEDLAVPWRDIPDTSFNKRVTGSRRFVAQSWDFDRVYKVSKKLGGTLNDTVLAMCAGALRLYLREHHELPVQSLKAMAPISLRAKNDIDSSNAVATICADLATNIADIETRYRHIQKSMIAGKEHLQQMDTEDIETYMMIRQLPEAAFILLGLQDKFPPFSVVISNIPGSRDQWYWNGAKMTGSYPVSVVTHGSALNITIVSNADHLDVGIVACRKAVPSVQRMIDYMEDALVELEKIPASSGAKA